MKTAVTDTSLSAYQSFAGTNYFSAKEKQVMNAFADTTVTLTRQQLVQAAGMPINCVCGRARALLDRRVLSVRGVRIDPNTHKTQELLGLPVAVQMELV